jgi:hypothetical protein
LLTHVHTTTAAVHEAMCTAPIQQALVEQDLPPSEHLVDAAYSDAELLVCSHKDDGITLRGPARLNPNWQVNVEGSYTLADFAVGWEHQQVHCPHGKAAASWAERVDATGRAYIQVRFPPAGLQSLWHASVLHTGDAGRPHLDTPPAGGI